MNRESSSCTNAPVEEPRRRIWIKSAKVDHHLEKETTSSEVTVSSSRQAVQSSQQLNFTQATMESHSESHMESSYNNHENEEEDFPKYTTKELRAHFEKTIEEAAPPKPIKIVRDINRAKWSSSATQSNTVATEVCEAPAVEAPQETVMDFEDFPPPPEDPDYLPPPPPDLLEMPNDAELIPEHHYSPEPPAISKCTLNRETYVKQRRMNELKRLYKHIHPEVRKNIEKECTEYSESANNRVETHEYMYEYDSDDMYDDEEGEWEEILPGEVQAMRWRFENKPLDAIKDETPEEVEDNRNAIEQEMILGKDVRRTAWMFETKSMDVLGSHNTNTTEYRNKFNKLDKGDVRAAAWLFETQAMDSLNKMHKEEDLTKEIVFTEEDGDATIYMIDNKYMESLGHTETIDESRLLSLRTVLEEINGEVKTVTSTFDTQFRCIIMGQSSQMLEIKSVRKIETELENSIASRWLFDTQPLDRTSAESSPLWLICSLSMEDGNKGDWGRWLFEIKTLNSLHDWESTILERKVVGADVRKHCMVFETQPMDTLKDDSNARSQTIEDIIGGNVRSARNFFENSPRVERKNLLDVGKLKKTVADEEMKGDVRHQKWRFESQPLEHIREEKKEVTRTVNIESDLTQEDGTCCRADVRKNCWVFETQPMDTLKDDSNTQSLSKEEIIAGNVRSARNYFETNPGEELKELAEVGKLKKRVALDEEKGDVRHQKWRFESQPLEQIREERKEVIRTIDLEEIDKVDVLNYKHIFESTDLTTRDESQKIAIEGVATGSVKSNKDLFESNQLYAMQDSSGHFHEVTTVRREEIMKGDVQTCKWMFETRPIDQFDENINEYQIIKGISKEEIESGDVKTAKWLFETQPLDAIKYFSNIEDEEVVSKSTDVTKGDVKTCKWLFETKPMDVLYDKVELENGNSSEEMLRGDVKTCTWLFETQALDEIRDENETILKTCTVREEDIQGKDVRKACFLFETEKLENLTGEEGGSYKRVTEIDIESGDVSKMKYIFENQATDIMTSTSEVNKLNLKRVQMEDIQRGNVVNCKWLFENQAIDTIHDSQEESIISRTVIDVHGGDVNKGRLIFETNSLDKIQEVSSDIAMMKTQRIVREEDEKGDVRNYTMMFETQPLYAIQDKEGHYHEVTTVTSEEVTRGDVVGTRWLFETKPLDAIRDTDEVYVIKSVTQQDVQKGDVTSAKWKFETQSLDSIAEENKALIRTVDDIQGGNVQINKQRFESDAVSQNSVRTVNVSEIQKGDVRSAKWRFETQSIDKIRSMSSENLIETVKKEEVAKGDVKQSVWLFEKNPLDHIKEVNEDESVAIDQEEIPKADVKTTTWLFETKPFGDFNEARTERTEIIGKSIKGTLEELYSQKMVTSKGILIETDEIGDVRMAKYHLMNQQAPEIQREEVIRGDLQTIMMNLLNKQERKERQVVVDSEEKGNISSTVQQLFNQERDSSVEREQILRGDIQKAITNLFDSGSAAKHGILIQEDEKGDVQMTIYSLMNQEENAAIEKEDIIRGDIKSALQSLADSNRQDLARIRVDDSEKGNVNFYSTCIESGALSYLRELNSESDEVMPEKEKIIGGDVKGTKYILCHNQTQIERTVEDVIPGDVQKRVQVFTSEPSFTSDGLLKEEIVRGDLKAALSSLSESANHTVVVEKEEVVKGNIPKALRCLERAQHRQKEVEKPDIVRGNIKGALRSLEKSATTKVEAVVDDLVPGDVKATLKSLEMAKKTVREVEKEEIIRGDIHMAMQSLQDANVDKVKCQQEIDVQGDVKGTIQLLLEPPPSPKVQRSAIVEDDVRGDVKMSIKALYEGQEQTQLEKEEVIKGDVKGKIKSLMETAQRETPKVRMKAYRRVKQRPPVKNLNADAQRNVQKIKTAKPVETENLSCLSKTESSEVKSSTVVRSTTQSKCTVEHKTITQNHGIKTLKTQFRNLNSKQKGMMKSDKTKVETDVYTLKVPESDLPLPPPPPPVADSDMLPPPPPPCIDSDIDTLPPPPPPLTSEPDFLPPPPSQQELESIPSPAKAKKMTVKKVNGPVLCPVPKLEKKVEFNKSEAVKTESVVHIKQSKITTDTSKRSSAEIPPPPESPKPLNKVSISPVRFTPPPSPTPSVKGKTSKFNTPLMKAEEKFKKLREERTPPTTPPPPYTHEALSSTHDLISKDEMTQKRSEIPPTVSEIITNTQSGVVSEVVVSGTTLRSMSHKKELIQADSTSITSKQKLSKKEMVSSVRQETSQISISSKQSSESIKTQQIQTVATDSAERLTAHSTEEQKTQASGKSENIQILVSSTQENISSNKKQKAAKSPERPKKADESHAKDQEKQVTPNTNGKSGKTSQKGKKNGKQAEKQVDIKTKSELVKQVEVMIATEVTVPNVPQKEKTETKPEVKVESTSPTCLSDAVGNVIENKTEPPTPAKKKKKSKKSKVTAQSGQSKDGVAESSVIPIKVEAKESAPQLSDNASQTVIDAKDDKKDSLMIKSKEDQAQQQKVTNHAKGKNKKADTVTPKSEERSLVEAEVIPITLTSLSEKAELKTSAIVREEKYQQQHVQIVKSHTREVQEVSEMNSTQSLNTQSIIASDLSPGQKGKQEVVSSSQEGPETISHKDTTQKQKCEAVSEKTVGGGASPRISKISIGSAKVENHVKRTTIQENSKEESSQSKSLDLRAPSPLLRMRSPSPTFITIESTRRTDSPQRVCLSPTLLHRPATPPTPPPRRCETPSRLTRITPSPTFDKAENLARLKDTTAKLSRGVTPPPPLYSQQISEKKSEIVESPASFQRQIKVESQMEVTSRTEVKEVHAASKNVEIVSESFRTDREKVMSDAQTASCEPSDDELSSASVREKRQFFEGAQKAEVNKTYVRKEPIDIPERLGPDMEECEELCANKDKGELPSVNLSRLVNKFESKEEKTSIGKGIVAEFDLDDLIRNLEEDITEHDMPTFDIQAVRDVFELDKQSYADKDEKQNLEEPLSTLTTTREDFSKLGNPAETKELGCQLNSLSMQKKEEQKKPEVLTETKSLTEHFSDFDEFGNLVSGTRTAVTTQLASSSTQQVPFSYADAVKRKTAAARRTETYDEDVTEKLLRNFHKTWTESETVFKSLGYTVSEECTVQASHQSTVVSSGSSSKVGAVHSMSEEGLPDGWSDSRRKKVP
ncbi:xin actin-binding repeat-containing protein 2 isoform X2 [Synchiropus splendidus]|uniref:xin actin-binding repeat-containing protein 2 isoform X2 n=1 Tax=Synchiropus splendidus TaxID=270530 RepID=UPI00237E5000|nr:xin actin-binding repeat-containing protein 2 isoform X2 [Synchiropus splendidus]